MFKNKKIIVTTGPSLYSDSIKSMVEGYFGGINLYCNQDTPDELEFVVSQMDALVLAGGSDIFRGTLGQPVTHGDGLNKFDIRRDKREKFLIEKAIELNKPILGICRGFQMLATHFGFYLIPNLGGDIAHSTGDIKVNYENGEFCHYINCLPEFQEIYFEYEGVFSAHHQGIYAGKTRQMNGMQVVATARTHTQDKHNCEIVEIIENAKLKIVGVAFHPEVDYLYGNVASNKSLERFKSFLK